MAATRSTRISTAVPATIIILFILFFALAVQAQKATPGASASGQASQCASCHEAVVKHYGATVHGKADRFSAGDSTNCASCHGDVAAHAETGDPAKIYNPGKDKALSASNKCLSCHSTNHGTAFWAGNRHETAKVGCLSCHSVHKAKGAKLLARNSELDTCLSCHTDMRKAPMQRSTHLFRDENRKALATCSSCHNVHGSATPKMIKRESVNDTCYSCHTDKRGRSSGTTRPRRKTA